MNKKQLSVTLSKVYHSGMDSAADRPSPGDHEREINAHAPAGWAEKLSSAALQHAVRLMVIVVQTDMYVVEVAGEPGLAIVGGSAPDLFDQIEAAGGFSAAASATMLGHARAAGRRGVEERREEHFAAAYSYQRFALVVTARLSDDMGLDVTTGNVWMINELIRNITVRALGPARHVMEDNAVAQLRAELDTVTAAVAQDAASMCEWFRDSGRIDSCADPAALPLLYSIHRLARLAGDRQLRASALERIDALSSTVSDSDVAFLVRLEDLLYMEGGDALVAARRMTARENRPVGWYPWAALITDKLMSESDGKGLNGTDAWNQYRALRKRHVDVRDPMAVGEALSNAYRHLAFRQLESTAGGGNASHEISHAVSLLLQYLGRDLVALLRLAGDQQVTALYFAEQILARSMVDWMARSHPFPLKTAPAEFRAAINPLTGSVNAVTPAELSEIARVAAERGPILYYLSQDDGFAAWLVRRDGQVIPASIGRLDELVREVAEHLPYMRPRAGSGTRDLQPADFSAESRVALDSALKKLHDALFPNAIQKALGDQGERLVIVADPALNAVPFSALRTTTGQYLLQDKELLFWQSVTAWLLIGVGWTPAWFRAAHEGPIKPAVFANSSSGQYLVPDIENEQRVYLSPLPGTLREVTTVGNQLAVEPLVDDAATRPAFFARGLGAPIVHLAMHGYLNEAHPPSSFLVLADGLVTAADIFNGELPSELVIMSACRSGLGALHPDSVIGLENAFLIAGADTVISTLWAIPDDSSATLMQAFYRRLSQGDTVPAALRAAQRELLGQPDSEHPSCWAAFRVTGLGANPLFSKWSHQFGLVYGGDAVVVGSLDGDPHYVMGGRSAPAPAGPGVLNPVEDSTSPKA